MYLANVQTDKDHIFFKKDVYSLNINTITNTNI